MLGGTLDVPRAVRNAEPPPQRRAQRTHDNAAVRLRCSSLMRQQRGAITRRYQALDGIVVIELNARRGMVSSYGKPLRRQTRETRGCVIENEGSSSEPFRPNASRARPMRWHKGHHGVAPPRLYHEASRRRLRQSDQADIQRAIRQSGQCFVRGEYRDLNVDSRMVLT